MGTQNKKAYTREEAMQFLIEHLDGEWMDSDIDDTLTCSGWEWRSKLDQYPWFQACDGSSRIYKHQFNAIVSPQPTNIETLVKQWSELRDEANILREQLTAAEQAERDAHARVEAALADMGWDCAPDKQDPSTWEVGDRFEVVGRGDHDFAIGEHVKLVTIESDGVHRYSTSTGCWRYVHPKSVRKL